MDHLPSYLKLFSCQLLLCIFTFNYSFAANLPSSYYDDYDVEKYEQQVRNLEQSFNHAKNELQQVYNNLERATNEETRLKNRMDEISRDIQQAMNHQQQLRANNRRFKQEIPRLQSNVQNFKIEVDSRQPQITNLQNQNNRLRQKVNTLKQKIQQERRALKPYQDKLNGAKKNLTIKKSQLNSKKRQLQNAKAKLNRINQDIQKLSSSTSRMEKQIISSKSQMTRVQSKIKKNNTTIINNNNTILAKQQNITNLRKQLQQAQNNGDKALENKLKKQINNEMVIIRRLRAQNDQLKFANQSLNKQLAGIQSSITRLNASLKSQKGQIANKKNQRKSQENIINTVTSQLNSLQAQVNTAQNQFNTAQTNYGNAAKNLQQLEARLSPLQNKLNTTNNQLHSLRTQQNKTIASIQRLESQIANKNKRIANNRAKIRNLGQKIQSMQSRYSRVRTDFHNAQNHANHVDQLSRDAEAHYSRIEKRLKSSEDRLRTVIANVDIAEKEVGAKANLHGKQDGHKEGAEDGNINGRDDGFKTGAKDGTAKGTSEGKMAAYTKGYNIGRSLGAKDGEALAQQEANTNGLKDGTNQGKTDGLAQAFEDGYQKGQSTANDTVAYNTAYQDTYKNGHQNAINEAKTEILKGFAQKEQEYLNATLNTLEINQNPITVKFSGLQQSISSSQSGRYYKPRPATYPHPRIQQFYMSAYDFSYRDSLATAYDIAYKAAYQTAYDSEFQQQRQIHASMAYPQSQKEGELAGYHKGKKLVYNITYEQVYPVAKQSAYTAAYNQHKTNTVKYDAGFKQGNALASAENGKAKGLNDGYSQNIVNEKQSAFQKGQQKADLKYSKAVVKAVELELVESNHDGVFQPGELIYINAKIKNYGKTAAKNLKLIHMPGLSKLRIAPIKETLLQIPPKSITTIKGAAQFYIPNNSFSQNLNTIVELKDSSSKLLLRDSKTTSIKFPVLISTNFDGVVLPSRDTTISVKLQNISNKTKNVDIVIDLDTSKITTNQSLEKVSLKAGASTTVDFVVQGQQAALFKETTSTIKVLEGFLEASPKLQMLSTIINKHQFTQTSTGLLIAGNLAKSGASKLVTNLDLDTWDLNIDGALEAKSITRYQNKLLHIVADDSLNLSTQDIRLIHSLVKKGMDLIVWGDVLVTQNTSQLQQLTGINSTLLTRADKAYGEFLLKNISQLPVNAKVLQLTGDAYTKAILSSDAGIIGISKVHNAWTDHITQVVSIGILPQDLNTALMQEIAKSLILSTSSSPQQVLNSVGSKPSDMQQLTNIIIGEIMFDDGDTSKQWFRKQKKQSNTFKILKAMIKNKSLRKTFAKYYPQAHKAVELMKDKKDQAYALRVIQNTGTFSKSWKSLWCREYAKRGEPICQRRR